jgi:hypothetical protein
LRVRPRRAGHGCASQVRQPHGQRTNPAACPEH